jgi:hypothetical protein
VLPFPKRRINSAAPDLGLREWWQWRHEQDDQETPSPIAIIEEIFPLQSFKDQVSQAAWMRYAPLFVAQEVVVEAYRKTAHDTSKVAKDDGIFYVHCFQYTRDEATSVLALGEFLLAERAFGVNFLPVEWDS